MRDEDVVKALCQLLAEATGWAWRPDGPAYTTDEVAIHYGPIAPAPDRAVGVTLYATSDELQTVVAVRHVQVRYRGARGDVAGADRLAADAFAALQGLARTAGLSLVTRTLAAQLGTDDSARQERADSYQIILDTPEVSS